MHQEKLVNLANDMGKLVCIYECRSSWEINDANISPKNKYKLKQNGVIFCPKNSIINMVHLDHI